MYKSTNPELYSRPVREGTRRLVRTAQVIPWLGLVAFGSTHAWAQPPVAPTPPPPAAPAPPAPVPPPPIAPPAIPPEPPPAPPEAAPPAAPEAPPPAASPAEPPTAPAPPETGEPQTDVLTPPPVRPIQLTTPSEPPPGDEEERWYEKIDVGAFVDSYFSLNYNFPKPQGGKNRFRAYDQNNGFSMSWVGLDLDYQGEHGGGTLDLRFGPSAARVAGETETNAGLDVVRQAFATWRTSEHISLDFGKFASIYGAEAPESQDNYNYTRGLLHSLAYPRSFTGLRANLDLSEQFWITALVANGWNNSVDNNFGKTFGIQLSTQVPNSMDPEAAPIFDAHLGYLIGPEQGDFGIFENFCSDPDETLDPRVPDCTTAFPEASSDRPFDAGDANTSGLRHLIDLVVGVHPSPSLGLLFNFDYGFENTRQGDLILTEEDLVSSGDPDEPGQAVLEGFSGQSYWGIAAMARYQFDPAWAGALRGEIYSDPESRATNDGDPYIVRQPDLMLYSATLTAEVAPFDGLLLRLDNRLDAANEVVFLSRTRTYESTQITTTLGVVVTTD